MPFVFTPYFLTASLDPDSALSYHTFFSTEFFLIYGASFLILFILLMIGFWVSGCEVALFSLSKNTRQHIEKNYPHLSLQLEHLLLHPKEVLVILVLINTFVNIGIILLMNILFSAFLKNWHSGVAWVITWIAEVFLLIIFSEITPKVWAANSNIQFCLVSVPPLFYVFKIGYPIAKIISRMTHTSEVLINTFTPYRKAIDNPTDALDKAIALTKDKEHKQEEIKLLQSLVRFKDIKVKEVMRSRLDICALNKQNNFTHIKEQIVNFNYSRLPVYEQNLDHIIGILYVKDLLPFLEKKNEFNWTQLMRPPFIVYEFNNIEMLLMEFKNKSLHFAVVLDEFGVTQGIITLEDILEEIIGDIHDEFDEEQHAIKQIKKGVYIVEGKISLNDFGRYFNIPTHHLDFTRKESDSLAGLILEISQTIPKAKEQIQWGKFIFIIEEIHRRRISKIRIQIQENLPLNP